MSEDRRAEAASSMAVAPNSADLLAVNERLLLAGLREQERAEEARHLANALEYRALHDPLTGLPNRTLFADRLEQLILVTQRDYATFALLFLDLDRFKAINDRLGHQAGDLLLQQVAARLRGSLRESDTLARLYGDEFAILLPGNDATTAAEVAQKLLGVLAPPCLLQGQPEQIKASIGIAGYPVHGTEASGLMAQADAAMYVAKHARSGYALAGFTEGQKHPRHTDTGPRDRGTITTGPTSTDELLQTVNERLLLAGLREQELVDQLRRQLAFTNAIVGNLGEGVCALDRACRIAFVNPAAERLLGWTEAEILGRDWDDVVPAHHTVGHPLLAAVREGAAYRDDDALFARQDGGTFAVAYGATPIVADTVVMGAALVFRDITDQQHAKAERAALLARVEAALVFRTRFLAITAHELKTPLTVLKGYTQLLLRRARRAQDDSQLRSLAVIDQQADKVTRLIDDLSDIPRIESDGLALNLHPLDLRALLAETVGEVGVIATDFALRLSVEGVRAAEVWVSGDRLRLQQVLTNLLTNAVKYASRRREAAITLHGDGDWARIIVTDYGIGIPAAQQATVFEPYVRADNALAGGYGGLGLGLFISKAIVERHGGTLALSSEEGIGSTFTLALPCLRAGEEPAGQ